MCLNFDAFFFSFLHTRVSSMFSSCLRDCASTVSKLPFCWTGILSTRSIPILSKPANLKLFLCIISVLFFTSYHYIYRIMIVCYIKAQSLQNTKQKHFERIWAFQFLSHLLPCQALLRTTTSTASARLPQCGRRSPLLARPHPRASAWGLRRLPAACSTCLEAPADQVGNGGWEAATATGSVPIN